MREIVFKARSNTQLNWYMGGNSLWMAATSLQTLIVTWLMVGVLKESPERVGIAQLIIAVPGLIFMLWGGAIGDRLDGRTLLLRAQTMCAIPALLLAAAAAVGWLNYWTLISSSVAVSLINAYSSAARFTILNRLATDNLQFAISLSTGIGAIAAIVGVRLGGEIDRIGVIPVLILQAGILGTGTIMLARLKAAPARQRPVDQESTLGKIVAGLRVTWKLSLARDVIALNCLSGFFNAGAWLVAMPFIVSRVYQGDAALLATMVMLFSAGTLVANFGLLKFLPLARPGRLYLILQLTRVIVLFVLWLQPSVYVVMGLATYWGFNMGITTTMSRLMVQETAPTTHLARVMSIYNLAQAGAVPLGAVVLGYIIGQWGPLDALIPGMFASLIVFLWGFGLSRVWKYRSDMPASRI